MTDKTRLELKAGIYVERDGRELRFTDEDGDCELFKFYSEPLAEMDTEALTQFAYAYMKGLGRGREQGRTGMKYDVWKALGFQELMDRALEAYSERAAAEFRVFFSEYKNGN